jgi:hypothetical protein
MPIANNLFGSFSNTLSFAHPRFVTMLQYSNGNHLALHVNHTQDVNNLELEPHIRSEITTQERIEFLIQYTNNLDL